MKMIEKFSDWFDTIKEPQRFGIFLIIMFGWYIPFCIITFLDDKFPGTELLNLKYMLMGIATLQISFLIVLAIHRANKIFRK